MATHPERASWDDLPSPPQQLPPQPRAGRAPPLLLPWGLRDPSSSRGSRVHQALAQSRTPSPAARTQRWETGGSCPRGPRIWRGEMSTQSASGECRPHRAREGSGVLGAGSVKASWGGTPGGCAKKREVLRGPEIIVHRGMGGPRAVQRSGERQEPNPGAWGKREFHGGSWDPVSHLPTRYHR